MNRRLRPANDVDKLPVAKEDIHHVKEIDITDQDLIPPEAQTYESRRRYFMGQLVGAPQQKFDDKVASRFLANYAATGRKVDSARAAGIGYRTLRNWEVASPEFAELIEEAKETYADMIHREIFRRGVEGVIEPVTGGKDGRIITYVRKYSDKMLELAARRADPVSYGNKDANVNINVDAAPLTVPLAHTIDNTPLDIIDVEVEED